VGRVIENLLPPLLDDDRFGGVTALAPQALKEPFLARFAHPRLDARFAPFGPMGARDLLLKGLVELRRHGKGCSLFLFPSHNAPPFVPGRYALTVNDVTVFTEASSNPPLARALFRRLLGRAAAGAAAVTTISETSRENLCRELSLPPARVPVFYPWVDDAFFSPWEGRRAAGGAALPSGGGAAAPACLREGEGGAAEEGCGPYLLYVGLRIAHKNLAGILSAFRLLAPDFPSLSLVVAGGRYRRDDEVDRFRREEGEVGARVIEVLSPADETVRCLMRHASAFLFPSFHEGFGLPPLEAMACGAPVVCSDIPVFREVYGDAALFADPRDPASIAGEARRVLSEEGVAERLRGRGRERAARFRKERLVGEWLDWVYGVATGATGG
jgi:glycosyltransferase involved in cell wall biosynthesis